MAARRPTLIGLASALWLTVAAATEPLPLLVRQRTEANGAALPVGSFTTDMVRYFERQTRLRFEPRPYPWKRAVALAEHGDGLLWGMPSDADTSGKLEFSKPVYTTHVWMIVRRGDHLHVGGLQDLHGKTISAYGGRRYGNAFERLRGQAFTVQEDPDSLDIRVHKLALGRVDVVLMHSRHNDLRQVRAGLEHLFSDTDTEVLPQPLLDEQICFAAARDSAAAAAIPALNAAIERGHGTRQLDRLVR
jgi:ABC-type amino acid transport substrate-binding protein